MNLKELESFLQIYQQKSIVKAARELFITPQGLGKTLKKLEDELGVPLFVRTQEGLEATKFGEVFRTRAENILAQMDSATMDFELLRHMDSASVKLVLSFGMLDYYSPQMILDFQQSHKNVRLDYTEAPDDQAESMIFNHKADLGILVGDLDSEKFECIPLRFMKLYAVINPQNPLSHRKCLSFSDLRNQKMITKAKNFHIRSVIERCCKQAEFSPNIIFEISGPCMCNTLCMENKGIVILDEASLQEAYSKELCPVIITDEMARIPVNLVSAKDVKSPWAVNHLAEFITEWNQMINLNQ
ncbi:MAG: LysR family transcriptional regulator [Oscillospiraceae bacterium]|nr:LysR family transcriptional regulator [Oscillospiraceae bacterium]